MENMKIYMKMYKKWAHSIAGVYVFLVNLCIVNFLWSSLNVNANKGVARGRGKFRAPEKRKLM